jgi:large subunit ribosomal protein L22
MEARAVRKYIRSSPRKMRTLVNLVRGKKVAEALSILHYLPHKATRPVELTIQSAVYNLMDRNKEERFDENELVVRDIRVDEGPMFKRHRPAPRGRAHPIKRHTAHLTVVVSTVEEEEVA